MQTQSIPIASLDDTTRSFLDEIARDREATDAAGIYITGTNTTGCGPLFVALVCAIAFPFVAWPPIHEPLAEAMLQTALLVPILWGMVTFVRAKRAAKLGSFEFFDAAHWYSVDGSWVTVTDLSDVTNVGGTVVRDDNGKYARTDIVLTAGPVSKIYPCKQKKPAERLVYFLNTVCWLRSAEGQASFPPPDETLATDYRSAVALKLVNESNEEEVSATGVALPPRVSAAAQGDQLRETPTPNLADAPSEGMGLVALMGIAAAFVGCVLVLTKVNGGFREDAIYARIEKIIPMEVRVPSLRLYLSDARHVKHRAKAEADIAQVYNNTADRIIAQGNNLDGGGLVKPDEVAFRKQFAEIVRSLKDPTKPPIVSVRVTNLEGTANDQGAFLIVCDELTKVVGPTLIQFVEAPENTPAMVEMAWKPGPPRIYEIRFRATPDAEAKVFPRTAPFGVEAQWPGYARTVSQQIGGESMGAAPPVGGEDF